MEENTNVEATQELAVPFKYPSNCILVKWEEVDQEGRSRTDYGPIDDLAESFMEYGIIHPPTVAEHPDPDSGYKWILTGGGRRFLTMNTLGCTLYPVNTREQLDDAVVAEMEVEENINRLNMTWQEECMTIYKAYMKHKAKARKLKTTWGAKQTGKIMGRSNAHVSHALYVVTYLLNGDEEIKSAKSINDAYSILLQRKEREGDRSRAARYKDVQNNAKSAKTSSAPIEVGDAGGDDLAGLLGISPQVVDPEAHKPVVDPSFIEQVEGEVNDWMVHCDSVVEGMPSLEDGSIDHIVTDPPYGIDITDYLATESEIRDQHDRQENLDMFEPMMKEFWRVTNDSAFVVVWYDNEHYQLLATIGQDLGFKLQRHPIIWHKTHRVKNTVPQFNYTKVTETAMVFRKPNATLQQTDVPCLVTADGALERRMYSNPFAKPYAVWKHCIEPISKPGDIILDPFAGNMSCPRACLNLNRRFRAFEFEEHHYNKGVTIINDLITEMKG